MNHEQSRAPIQRQSTSQNDYRAENRQRMGSFTPLPKITKLLPVHPKTSASTKNSIQAFGFLTGSFTLWTPGLSTTETETLSSSSFTLSMMAQPVNHRPALNSTIGELSPLPSSLRCGNAMEANAQNAGRQTNCTLIMLFHIRVVERRLLLKTSNCFARDIISRNTTTSNERHRTK